MEFALFVIKNSNQRIYGKTFTHYTINEPVNDNNRRLWKDLLWTVLTLHDTYYLIIGDNLLANNKN